MPEVVDGGLKGQAQLVGAGGGDNTGVGGESRFPVSAAERALGGEAPTKD